MTFEEMVRSLTKDGGDILKLLSSSDVHLWHMATGISGEAGELLDAVKKSMIYNRELDIDNVIEELGDIEFYLQGMRQALGLKRSHIIMENMEKLSKRYGNLTYSDESAIKRQDKT